MNENRDTMIKKVAIELPPEDEGKLAFILHNTFTKEECDQLIQKSEAIGYVQAEINVGSGRMRLMLDIRNSARCMWDTEEEADKIFTRIKDFLPSTWRNETLTGVYKQLRILRYNPGQYFKPHFDGPVIGENKNKSYITIQMYLNQGFKGGETTFLNYDLTKRYPVLPKKGSVLIFQHDILHEGSLLTDGVKYALRADIMYSSN